MQVVTVTGTATDDTAVATLTVNGTPATLNADGTWTATVPVTAGHEPAARDRDRPVGQRGQAIAPVVAGPMSPVSTTVPNGITAALSAQTFAAIGTGAGNYIKTADLESLISSSNPVISDGAPNGPDCLYVQGSITSMTIGGAQIALVPQTGGLALDAELSNVNIGMHLDYAAACINGSRDITIAATHVSITGNMAIGVANGQFAISARLRRTSRSPASTPSSAALTGDIVDLLDLNDAFGPLIGWATEKFVVPMINTAFDGLNETKTITVFSRWSTSRSRRRRSTSRAQAASSSWTRRSAPKATPSRRLRRRRRTRRRRWTSSQGFQLAVAANAANQAVRPVVWSAQGPRPDTPLNNGSYGDIGTLFDSVESPPRRRRSSTRAAATAWC